MNSKYTIPAKVTIGHVDLKVADLQCALDFYCGLLGFNLISKFDSQSAFISAGGYHHHIGLNTWQSKNGPRPPANATGLYHFAILYPTRKDLAAVYKRILDARYPVLYTADHGVSEAIYVNDPDGNAIELCRYRPREQCITKKNGSIEMYTIPLDTDDLLKELE